VGGKLRRREGSCRALCKGGRGEKSLPNLITGGSEFFETRDQDLNYNGYRMRSRGASKKRLASGTKKEAEKIFAQREGVSSGARTEDTEEGGQIVEEGKALITERRRGPDHLRQTVGRNHATWLTLKRPKEKRTKRDALPKLDEEVGAKKVLGRKNGG